MDEVPTRRIPVEALRGFGTEALRHHGLSPEHAEVVEANLLEADLRGVTTHGHVMLHLYCERVRNGLINTGPTVRVVREHSATILVDGDRGLGQIAAQQTMQAVIRAARVHGTALGLTRNSSHLGAVGHYAMMALDHDMIGYAATNTLPSLFPHGGRTRVGGNNPIAYAIPAGRKRPLVLDMSLAATATNRILMRQQFGQPIPEGWMVDRRGEPTIDPADLLSGGASVPIGGPKGVGLAQAIDAIAGVLSGAAFGMATERDAAGEHLGGTGHVFQAIDIAAFMPVDEFKRRMDEQIQQMHDADRMEGVARIFVAGERAWEHLDDARANGVPLPEPIVDDLNQLAVEAGMAGRL